MIKKVGIVTALSTAILFGGAFNSSADAAASDQSQNLLYNTKIVYSLNGGEWQQLSNQNMNDFISNYFSKFNLSQFNWNSASAQSKPAAPVKQEQPAPVQKKAEAAQPAQPAQKQEEPKQAQKQEAPAQQQTVKQPTQTQQPQQQQQASNQLSQFEQQVVDLTNQERAKNGLSPLQVDLELSKVAREKSRDMSVNGYFDHNSPTYGSPFDMMRSYGITYRTAGENIAKGQRTPAEVVNAWMNSAGHRANILNGNFTHIGVGFVEQGNVWTQQFIGK